MIEHDPHDPNGDHDDLTPPVDVPDHHHAHETFSEDQLPPLDDPGQHAGTLAPELHFPGEPAGHDVPVTGLDPSAPWHDDDHFSQWLGDHDSPEPVDDPGADGELRDQLAAPPEDADGLPSSQAFVEWLLRQRAAG
jgi:hypothetical protein